MVAIVSRWGNSLAIRIPQNLAKEIKLLEGDQVDLTVVDGKIIINPKSRKSYSLDELVNAITAENLHNEVDTSIAVGNEVW